MISDNERREVARKLRGFVTDDSMYATVDVSNVLHVLGLYYADIDRIYFCGYDVARLADLIDPMRTDEETVDSWGQIYDDMCPRDDGMTFEEFERRCKALGEGK